ncbi:MAG TPA: Calx-beta domain-containing protein [Chryseolinea sp.]|nr:Calx-beta domain-containing protein [Chryseolinea sp.]
MRKYSILFLSALTLGSFVFVFTSCDDDEPPAKPKLSFATATLTAKESDENLQIQVVLDKAASEDITVEYSLSGTALDDVTAGNTAPADYEVISDFGEIEIEEGQTTGIIELNLLSDGEFEEDESIEISIDDVSSENIELTRDDEVNITLQQEDGRIILLEWPAPSASGQADMDIILRVGDNTTTWAGVLSGAAQGSFEGPEVLFIPTAVTYAAFGLSYVYYDGTLDPLEFTATFVDFANGAAEAEAQRESFDGIYTIVNKNKWTDVNTTIVVQTFQKTGGAFTSPTTPITIPPAGSRMSSSSLLTTAVKKQHTIYPMSEKIKAMLK